MVAVNVLEPFNGIIHFLAAQLAVVVCWSMPRGSRGACSPAGGGRAARSSVGGTRAVFLSNTPSFLEQLQRELEFVFAFTLPTHVPYEGHRGAKGSAFHFHSHSRWLSVGILDGSAVGGCCAPVLRLASCRGAACAPALPRQVPCHGRGIPEEHWMKIFAKPICEVGWEAQGLLSVTYLLERSYPTLL